MRPVFSNKSYFLHTKFTFIYLPFKFVWGVLRLSNDLQTNLRYIIMIDYDSFSRCHLTDIFFAIHAGAKELRLRIGL